MLKAHDFRERAEELRSIASSFWTDEAAERLVRLAESYEKMALALEKEEPHKPNGG